MVLKYMLYFRHRNLSFSISLYRYKLIIGYLFNTKQLFIILSKLLRRNVMLRHIFTFYHAPKTSGLIF